MLSETAKQLVTSPKGILAADESNSTMNKRLAAVGLPEEEEIRHAYRELLFTTEGIEAYISGIILYDETIRQNTFSGTPFLGLLREKGIIPGIKVDEGLIPDEVSEGEQVTQGLDTLSSRLAEYRGMGARFTKWRAVVHIDERRGLPTHGNIERSARILSEYARLSQESGCVPIIEPEVLMNGTHAIEKTEEVLLETLGTVFESFKESSVDMRGLLLKSSMVVSGKDARDRAEPREVAERTVRTFLKTVPEDIPGIVFLSGGQDPIEATENLEAIAEMGEQPWRLTFSFSRALHEPVLEFWREDDSKKDIAQQLFLHRAEMNSLASMGKYSNGLEE